MSGGDRDGWRKRPVIGLADIERSALVQLVDIGADAGDRIAATAERFEIAADQVEHTPFLLIGSVEQIVDKLERLRDDVGISHYVIRDAESFAPVVDALAGR